MKTLLTLLILFIFQASSFSQVEIDSNYHYTKSDTINGQIETAKRMKYYMDAKQYDKAILLFSKKQKREIRAIQKDKEKFAYWCLAWTMNDEKLQRYIARIKRGKGQFVYESKMWKIDEK